MSTTRNGPSAGSSSETAPVIDSLASSLPASSSGANPVTSPAASRNSSPLLASRTAEVATSRPRSTPNWSIWRRNSRNADRQRSMASAPRAPVASTPSPSRVIRILRSSGTPFESAMSSRVELVPQSTATTDPRSCMGPCYHDRPGATTPDAPLL